MDEAHIAIETINYAANSFCYICRDGFITAEVEVDGAVVAATGADGFTCFVLNERIRRIQRYSYQRPAAEGYRLTPSFADWRCGKPCENAVETTVETASSLPITLYIYTAKPFRPAKSPKCVSITRFLQVLRHRKRILHCGKRW